MKQPVTLAKRARAASNLGAPSGFWTPYGNKGCRYLEARRRVDLANPHADPARRKPSNPELAPLVTALQCRHAASGEPCCLGYRQNPVIAQMMGRDLRS